MTDSYSLSYAGRVLVDVVPHESFPQMWLMIAPNAERSDFGNMSRIKDAAEVIYGRGRDSRMLKWKRNHFDRPAEACVEAPSVSPAVTTLADELVTP